MRNGSLNKAIAARAQCAAPNMLTSIIIVRLLRPIFVVVGIAVLVTYAGCHLGRLSA